MATSTGFWKCRLCGTKADDNEVIDENGDFVGCPSCHEVDWQSVSYAEQAGWARHLIGEVTRLRKRVDELENMIYGE